MSAKYPDQQFFFAAWNRQSDIKALNNLLVGMSTPLPPRFEARSADLNMLLIFPQILRNEIRICPR